MKPLKSGLSFSNWLLRIAIALFLMITFLEVVKTYNFSDKEFYISTAYVVFGILLFIGGFASPALTVISGFILTGLSLYKIFILFSGNLNPTLIANYFIILAVGFYFACAGNE